MQSTYFHFAPPCVLENITEGKRWHIVLSSIHTSAIYGTDASNLMCNCNTVFEKI